MIRHLAQLNIGRLLAPIDDPKIAGFKNNLDSINALAEQSPGFIWRLKDETNNATAIASPFGPDVIVNMSVWRGFEELRLFTYKTNHAQFIKNRAQWFESYPGRHMVLWWVPDGHEPSLEEAQERLEELEKNGPGPQAFIFSKAFTPSGEPLAKKNQRQVN